jgi:hypothetical protein
MVDWLLALMTPSQWDAWRNWLATIGGLVALLLATNTYRRNGKIKREEQARLVYSKVTHVEMRARGTTFPLLMNGAQIGTATEGRAHVMNPDPSAAEKRVGFALEPLLQATVIVHNGSKELIGPARIQMVHNGIGKVWDSFSQSVSTIGPESDFVFDMTWINEADPGFPPLGTTVIFRDASGQWWRRHLSEPVERVHDDPENYGLTPTERISARAQQKAQGIPEALQVKEPKVGVSVRWHRFWRVRRGKSATP